MQQITIASSAPYQRLRDSEDKPKIESPKTSNTSSLFAAGAAPVLPKIDIEGIISKIDAQIIRLENELKDKIVIHETRKDIKLLALRNLKIKLNHLKNPTDAEVFHLIQETCKDPIVTKGHPSKVRKMFVEISKMISTYQTAQHHYETAQKNYENNLSEPKAKLLTQLPLDIFQHALSHLSSENLNSAAQASRIFTKSAQTQLLKTFWKEKILSLGVEKSVLNSLPPIIDFKDLHCKLKFFASSELKELTPWMLCFISGNEKAIDEVKVQTSEIDFKKITNNDTNALHFAALGGSIAAMEHARTQFNIAPNSTDNHGRNALHFAALGRSIAAMEHARTQFNIAPNSTDNDGTNALHFAALGGSIAAMEHARTQFNIAPNSTNNNGRNALHFAALGGSIAAQNYLRSIGLT